MHCMFWNVRIQFTFTIQYCIIYIPWWMALWFMPRPEHSRPTPRNSALRLRPLTSLSDACPPSSRHGNPSTWHVYFRHISRRCGRYELSRWIVRTPSPTTHWIPRPSIYNCDWQFWVYRACMSSSIQFFYVTVTNLTIFWGCCAVERILVVWYTHWNPFDARTARSLLPEWDYDANSVR